MAAETWGDFRKGFAWSRLSPLAHGHPWPSWPKYSPIAVFLRTFRYNGSARFDLVTLGWNLGALSLGWVGIGTRMLVPIPHHPMLLHTIWNIKLPKLPLQQISSNFCLELCSLFCLGLGCIWQQKRQGCISFPRLVLGSLPCSMWRLASLVSQKLGKMKTWLLRLQLFGTDSSFELKLHDKS